MVKGRLYLHLETGMEGAEWTVIDNEHAGFYQSLHDLENGDRLTIYDRGKPVWDGEIKKDLTTNLSSETAYPYPRQVVQKYIVHWLQEGVNPDEWAKWFTDEKECTLEKKLK